MSITMIILVLGIIVFGIGIGKILRDKSQDKNFAIRSLSLPILGFLMILTPSTFAWIILGIVNGFVALPSTITIPTPTLSISPIWLVALGVGLIGSIFAFAAIQKNANKAGMSYTEYIESKMPQEDTDPVENAQHLLDDEVKDQTTTQKTSSDQ